MKTSALVVDAHYLYSLRGLILVAAGLGCSSVVGIWCLDQINEAMDYELAAWIHVPLLLGVAFAYPIAVIAFSYCRLARTRRAFGFALVYGGSWYATMAILQAVEYGIWKGFSSAEETALNLIVWNLQFLGIVVVACTLVSMMVWGICRLIRGKVIINSGGLCPGCAYDLTGNTSGTCPECGQVIHSLPLSDGLNSFRSA